MSADNYYAPDGYRYGVMYHDGSVSSRWNGATQRQQAERQAAEDARTYHPDDITLVRHESGGAWERVASIPGPGMEEYADAEVVSDGLMWSSEMVARIVAAERARWVAEVEALHKPYAICDDCDHDHTDEDVREGRAFDTGYSYTCTDAMLYIACRSCCVGDPDDPEQTEDCVTYHEHSRDPADRCPTAALVARLGGAE